VLSDKEKSGWDAIDEEAMKAGGYLATPKRPLIIEFDYRAMSSYCREKGVTQMDLSDDELKMFEYDEPLIYA